MSLLHTYIIGAGFSKGYNPKLIPVMSDFFEIAEENNSLSTGSFKELVDFITRHFGELRSANLETVATFLKMNLTPDPEEDFVNKEALYTRLIELVQKVLGEAYSNPTGDEVFNLYQTFARILINQKAHVISFNYDLILDNLLRNTKEWWPLDGYGVNFRVFENYDKKSNKKEKSILPSKCKLLKLHGSLNWGKSNIPDIYDGDSVKISISSMLSVKDIPILPISVVASTVRLGTRTSIYYIPFVIPPILYKEQFDNEPIIKTMWYSARDSIYKAKYITIIGYSFPPSDFLTEFMIRQAIAKQPKIFSDMINDKRIITCINIRITDEYKQRIRSLFGDAVYHFKEMGFVTFMEEILKKL